MILEYAALSAMPLGTATTILYTSPAWIVLWAAVLLGEPVKPLVMFCLLACFTGLLLVVQPWSNQRTSPIWAYTLVVVAAILAGLVYISLRQLKDVSYHLVVNTFMIACLVLSVVTGGLLHQLAVPALSSPAWVYIFGVALAAYGAEVCMTIGFAHARGQLARLSVLKFMSPIFSYFWGACILGEETGAMQLAGAGIIVASLTVVVYQMSAFPQNKAETRTERPGLDEGDADTCSDLEARRLG